MAVNRTNAPAGAAIRISGIYYTVARVLFENRMISVNDGVISDYLAPFGSQIYLVNIRPEKTSKVSAGINLIKDPGFEDLSSPGIPSAC